MNEKKTEYMIQLLEHLTRRIDDLEGHIEAATLDPFDEGYLEMKDATLSRLKEIVTNQEVLKLEKQQQMMVKQELKEAIDNTQKITVLDKVRLRKILKDQTVGDE